MEDVDHNNATEVHASVRDTLIGDAKPEKKNLIADLFKDFGSRLKHMDKQGAPHVLASLKSYLDSYDSQTTPFSTIQKYTEYRILNVGFGFVILFPSLHLIKCTDRTRTVSWKVSCNGPWVFTSMTPRPMKPTTSTCLPDG
jgi:hypothetical protein